MAKPDTPAPRDRTKCLTPLTPATERLIRRIYSPPPHGESEEDPPPPPGHS